MSDQSIIMKEAPIAPMITSDQSFTPKEFRMSQGLDPVAARIQQNRKVGLYSDAQGYPVRATELTREDGYYKTDKDGFVMRNRHGEPRRSPKTKFKEGFFNVLRGIAAAEHDKVPDFLNRVKKKRLEEERKRKRAEQLADAQRKHNYGLEDKAVDAYYKSQQSKEDNAFLGDQNAKYRIPAQDQLGLSQDQLDINRAAQESLANSRISAKEQIRIQDEKLKLEEDAQFSLDHYREMSQANQAFLNNISNSRLGLDERKFALSVAAEAHKQNMNIYRAKEDAAKAAKAESKPQIFMNNRGIFSVDSDGHVDVEKEFTEGGFNPTTNTFTPSSIIDYPDVDARNRAKSAARSGIINSDESEEDAYPLGKKSGNILKNVGNVLANPTVSASSFRSFSPRSYNPSSSSPIASVNPTANSYPSNVTGLPEGELNQSQMLQAQALSEYNKNNPDDQRSYNNIPVGSVDLTDQSRGSVDLEEPVDLGRSVAPVTEQDPTEEAILEAMSGAYDMPYDDSNKSVAGVLGSSLLDGPIDIARGSLDMAQRAGSGVSNAVMSALRGIQNLFSSGNISAEQAQELKDRVQRQIMQQRIKEIIDKNRGPNSGKRPELPERF